jgi:ABC-type antimicrobial peptide transport system permease subunit
MAVCRELLTRARALPGVKSATLASIVLLEGSNAETRVQVGDAPAGDASRLPLVSFDAVGSEYFETMSIPIVSGRGIDETDITSKRPVTVITEAMARHLWPNESALGRIVRFGGSTGEPYEVVGIARDVKYYMIGESARELMFLPLSSAVQGDLALQVKSDVPATVIGSQLEALVRQLEPALPPARAKAMRDDMFLAYLPARIGAIMFGSFGLLALIIAMVGIYGVTSYIVAQRTRELGVRAALGAQQRDLVGVGLRDTFRLVGIGVAIGLPLSYGVARVLTMLPILYDTRAGDLLVLGPATLTLVLVASVASYLPARRAGRADPLTSLRAR